MALVYADRVKETSTTTGTGTYDLAGTVTGFRTFVVGIGTTNTCYYTATDGINWEVGLGTVTDATPDTLARTTILASSNAGAAVNWAAGTRDIFCTIPAAAQSTDVQTFTSSGTWTKPNFGTMAFIQVWGGGGSGASRTTTGSVGGGGGGGYNERWVLLSSLGATETVTLNNGGAGVSGNTVGNAGGDTTFGAWLTGFGGGGGETNAVSTVTDGGYGAGQTTGSTGAGAINTNGPTPTSFGGARGAGISNSNAAVDAKSSYYGGGGGGSACSTGPVTGTAGTSTLGGNGGAANGSGAGTAGTQPGGGGGASRTGTSGAGAKGKVVVTVI